MELIYIKEHVVSKMPPIVATLGQFDGLHVGHLKLFKKTLELSKEKGLKSAVITFDPHPDFVLGKDATNSYITPFEKKKQMIESIGFDFLIVINFNQNFASISPEEFVQDYLIKLNVSSCVVGFDFTFGNKGLGKAHDIATLSKGLIDTIVIEEVKTADSKISSIDVKKSLVKGDVKTASILLGRYFEVTGIVAYGNQVGSKINVPTANILYDDEYVGLAKGVYVTIFEYEGKSYPSITNIGHNPSFNYSNKLSMECHVLNFCLDVYQKEVTIKFVEKIRDEIKFDSVSSFKKQIEKDKIFALNILNNR